MANRKHWRNIYYALGKAPTTTEFTPNSIPTAEVLSILENLLPEFSKELVGLCVSHAAWRNIELHTGEVVFANLPTSTWLPKYYASCRVLLQSMDKTLGDLFSDPGAAEEMISSFEDTAAKAVRQDIEEHRRLFENKIAEEQETSLAQATVWATQHAGHRTKCPACGSPALIHGSRHGAVTTEISEDMIVQTQSMMPSSFECVACDLRISGLSKLSASGLGDEFTATSSSLASDFFGLYTEKEFEQALAESSPEWESDFEPDFNE